MEQVNFGTAGEFSRLVYGVWRLADDKDTSPGHVERKIRLCLDQGIDTFDHADIYGDYVCEELFGAALNISPDLKGRIKIVTKCDIMLVSEKFPDRRVKYYDTSSAHIRQSVDTSLERIGVDVIDLLLIHRPDPLMDHHETGHALDRLVTDGKVKAVGVSNFKPHDFDLLQSAMQTRLVTNQVEISLLQHSSFLDGTIAQLQRLAIHPMAWSPLAGGRLFSPEDAAGRRLLPRLEQIGREAGVGPDAVALAWLLAHPCRICPVVGTNSIDRIGKLADALKSTIDRETWFELWTLAAGHEVP